MRALVIRDCVVVSSTPGRAYSNEYSNSGSLDNHFIVVYAKRDTICEENTDNENKKECPSTVTDVGPT